jgi:hypothetical protein
VEETQLFAMCRAQARQRPRPLCGERQPLASTIVRVGSTHHEARVDGPVDELDHRVMLELEELGSVGDRRRLPLGKTANGEQQLVLVGGEPFRSGRSLGEVQEDAKGVPELRQGAVLAVGQVSRRPLGGHATRSRRR